MDNEASRKSRVKGEPSPRLREKIRKHFDRDPVSLPPDMQIQDLPANNPWAPYRNREQFEIWAPRDAETLKKLRRSEESSG